ncbi:uncharacterized protein LOC142771957 isoform X1 [Rhipicephalus microplus]|uniref:uncharacterized protein LOC142771957 isoform X1 n=1 Tax=Rhipicephalus microplus TaxID=6941 RepID=UPI003F6B56F3
MSPTANFSVWWYGCSKQCWCSRWHSVEPFRLGVLSWTKPHKTLDWHRHDLSWCLLRGPWRLDWSQRMVVSKFCSRPSTGMVRCSRFRPGRSMPPHPPPTSGGLSQGKTCAGVSCV